jgi:Mlc titration factor MtfA (ptsG expression regulator)
LRLPRSANRRAPGLDDAQDAVLRAHLPIYASLPEELRRRAGMLTHALLQRLRFVGCNGLAITDPIRLVIAFQPCLLLANRGIDALGGLASVLVYPDEFLVHERDEDDAGVVTEGSRALSGQTIDTSRIVLSWQDVLDGLSVHGSEGYNVVIHEFAHHLDHVAEGLLSASPARLQATAPDSWHDVLAREYDALCAAVAAGEDSLIDPYGAEDPAEFFAVATETFFELPQELADHNPRLFDLLREFFDLDPREWRRASGTGRD